MGGWAATEAAIDLQFQKAEQQGVCLVSSSRSLRRALAARASEDMLISPLPRHVCAASLLERPVSA